MEETLGLVPSDNAVDNVKTKLSIDATAVPEQAPAVPEQAPAATGATKSASKDEGAQKKPSMHKAESITKRSSSRGSASATEQSRLSRTKVRKQSIGMSQIAGIKPSDTNQSQLGVEFRRPTFAYINTYQLGPKVPFHYYKVVAVIDEVLNEMFTDHVYSVIESPTLAMKIATTILRRVKILQFNRYRILSLATIGQKRAQSYNTAVSFLWDPEWDSYVELHRDRHTCFIQIVVFGIYLD